MGVSNSVSTIKRLSMVPYPPGMVLPTLVPFLLVVGEVEQEQLHSLKQVCVFMLCT